MNYNDFYKKFNFSGNIKDLSKDITAYNENNNKFIITLVNSSHKDIIIPLGNKNRIPIRIKIKNVNDCRILQNAEMTELQHLKKPNFKEEYLQEHFLEILKTFNIDCDYVMLTRTLIIQHMKIIDCDRLEPYEYPFIAKCRGQMVYLKEKNITINKCFQYDMNSCYAFVLTNDKFYFPIRKGTNKTIKSLKEVDQNKYYMIRLDVEKSKYFYYDPEKTYYTNIDVKLFDEQKIEYTLVECNNNYIEYDKTELIQSKLIFGNLFEKLYKLKKNGNKIAGTQLRMIHGSMCKELTKIISLEDLKKEQRNDIIKIENGKIKLTLRKFSSSLARFKPFMFAFLRKYLFKQFINNGYEIFRIKTDSILISECLHDSFIGNNIGEMKFVGSYKNLFIKHVNEKI